MNICNKSTLTNLEFNHKMILVQNKHQSSNHTAAWLWSIDIVYVENLQLYFISRKSTHISLSIYYCILNRVITR